MAEQTDEAATPSGPQELWGYAEVAAESGVKVGTIRYYWSQKRHLLPEPFTVVGKKPVWLPDAVREWAKNRPGQGFRTDLKDTDA